MNDHNSIIYKFLKKCEVPPRETRFWIFMNFIFNSLLIYLGRIIAFISYPNKNNKTGYVLMSSMNMGDLLFLYRSLDLLKIANGFSNIVVLAAEKYRKPMEALGISEYRILPFWKIMSLDKLVQIDPTNHLNLAISMAWLFFGVEDIGRSELLRIVPCSISSESIHSLFPKKEMEGNSVILSPYEQSLRTFGEINLPWEFWTRLVIELKKRGYYVFTNCNGKDERKIDGTIAFFPSMGELAGAVQYAGYCVSIRSGFTDWICSAKLKREVVFYPSKKFYTYHNLHLLWGKKDALEFVYNMSNLQMNKLADRTAAYIAGEVDSL